MLSKIPEELRSRCMLRFCPQHGDILGLSALTSAFRVPGWHFGRMRPRLTWLIRQQNISSRPWTTNLSYRTTQSSFLKINHQKPGYVTTSSLKINHQKSGYVTTSSLKINHQKPGYVATSSLKINHQKSGYVTTSSLKINHQKPGYVATSTSDAAQVT